MKTRKQLVLCTGVALTLIGIGLIPVWWQTKGISETEQQRRRVFEQHAAISENARQQFEELFTKLPRESRTPDVLASTLKLDKPLNLVSRSNGGKKARIEMPKTYSRLILSWDDAGNSRGFAWEIVTPAAGNASWARHIATQPD
jgi:hypothetical protein